MRAGVAHTPIVKSLVWPDETATQLFAAALAAQPALHNALIELQGDLGAGKTTLVRHLLRALGVQGRIKSPTYAVVEPYTVHPELVEGECAASTLRQAQDRPGSARTELAIWHFDFYRFSEPREWEDAGFRDLFASPGLKLVEWPEKAAGFLPRADLAIHLEAVNDDARQVTLRAQTAVGLALLQAVSHGLPPERQTGREYREDRP